MKLDRATREALGFPITWHAMLYECVKDGRSEVGRVLRRVWRQPVAKSVGDTEKAKPHQVVKSEAEAKASERAIIEMHSRGFLTFGGRK
jgi:hypothetical protein